MPTLHDLEPQVLALPDKERAELASFILASLPPFLSDQDEGISEALRREQEAETDPSVILSLAQFEQGILELRRR